MNRKLLSAFALAYAPLLWGSGAYAVPITPSPTIIVGDKTFNNFTCNVVTGSGLTCAQIDVSGRISVAPPDATNGDPGIRIQGAFNAGTTNEDVVIEYDATASGGFLIHDASMFFNGTVTTSVTEDIFNKANNHLIGHLVVSNPPPNFTDDIVLTENALSIHVVKDIQLNFTAPGPTVISIVDQNFSQTVPEPASLTLLGSALIGLGWFGYRRRKTA